MSGAEAKEITPQSVLGERLAQREQQDRDRGLLSQLVYGSLHFASRSDEASLQQLRQKAQGASGGNVSVADAQAAVKADRSAADWRENVAYYTTEFAKTLPLFMGKGRGYLLSAALNGLDDMRLGTSPEMMAADFAIGAARGTAFKWGVDKFSGSSAALWKRGAALGAGSGFLDTGLSSKSWYDANTKEWHVTDGLKDTLMSTGLGLAAGAISFPIGAKLAEAAAPAAQRWLGTSVSPRVATMMGAGLSFGFTSGAVDETVRQVQSSEALSPSKIVMSGLGEGGIDLLAGGLGSKWGGRPRAPRRVSEALNETKSGFNDYFQRTLRTRTVEAAGSRYEGLTPDQLEQAILRTKWQPYDHPAIQAPAVGFRGNLPGRLGMIELDKLPSDQPLWLIDPKRTGYFSAATRGVPGPKVDFSTLILGPEEGKEIVYTVHPGDPVNPSQVTTLPETIAAKRLPGDEVRIPVTADEVRSLGLTLVKIES